MFVLQTSTSITIRLIYVDDILLTGSDPTFITQLISHMHASFAMRELGNKSYFLGISVTPTPEGYFLSQQKYALEILSKAGISDCKPYPSPMAAKPIPSTTDATPFPQPSLYRSLVGALQYMTITRPDLALAVNSACQHMYNPTIGDFKAVK